MDVSQVIIREARASDAEGMITFRQLTLQEPNSQVVTAPGEFNVTVEEQQEFIRKAADSGNSIFVVADDGGRIVGMATVEGGRRRAARHNGAIGITLHSDYRDKGLGTRMMEWIVDWARTNPVLTRLELEVFSRNARAIHVYEKLGFVREGVRRKAFFKDGEYLDSVIMALLFE